MPSAHGRTIFGLPGLDLPDVFIDSGLEPVEQLAEAGETVVCPQVHVGPLLTCV